MNEEADMEPWQERVISERNDLVDKIVKLDESGRASHDQLLRWQLSIMHAYCDVLNIRISQF